MQSLTEVALQKQFLSDVANHSKSEKQKGRKFVKCIPQNFSQIRQRLERLNWTAIGLFLLKIVR